MLLRKVLLFLVMLTLCVDVGGCAVYRNKNRPQVGQWPPNGQGANVALPTLRAKFLSHDHYANGSPYPPQKGLFESGKSYQKRLAKDLADFSKPAQKAFEEFSGGKLAIDDAQPADVTAEVTIRTEEHVDEMVAFLCGFFMLIPPAVDKIDITLKMTFKDKSGQVLATTEQTEQVSFVIEFFLLFAMPFNRPNTQVENTIYDVTRRSLIEAQKKNVFKAPQQSANSILPPAQRPADAG